MVLWGDNAMGKQYTQSLVIRRDLGTSKKLRNYQKEKKKAQTNSDWGVNREDEEERGYLSQTVEGLDIFPT